jgi:hypothetical protein
VTGGVEQGGDALRQGRERRHGQDPHRDREETQEKAEVTGGVVDHGGVGVSAGF